MPTGTSLPDPAEVKALGVEGGEDDQVEGEGTLIERAIVTKSLDSLYRTRAPCPSNRTSSSRGRIGRPGAKKSLRSEPSPDGGDQTRRPFTEEARFHWTHE